MSVVLGEFVEPPRPCPYLGERTACLEYRVMVDVDLEDHDALLVHGWRRFGPAYFRPRCGACTECVSLRVSVAGFRPSASQRRAARRCRGYGVCLQRPRVDQEHLDLYARWHQWREEERGWDPVPLDGEEYFTQLAFPHPAAHEMSFYDGSRLVGVGLCDISLAGWSAVFFYYDPEIARASPGVAHVLLGIEEACARGIPHVYLGYRVAGCSSMGYKSAFRPHELLVGRPGDDDVPRWSVASGGSQE